jgi:aspartate dehydrogenase
MAAFADSVGALPNRDVAELLAGDYPLLLEAASIDAVRDHLPQALEAGKDAVVLSVGALTDGQFLARIRQQAAAAGRRVYVPSGAIFGLDNLKAAGIAGLRRLLLKTTKPPRALGLPGETAARLVFSGTAAEAVSRFPKNINVSAALGLAAGREPEVELWVDPAITGNRHEILAEGHFGRVAICTDNLPSPNNPATSYLAALSVLALLVSLEDPIRIGT